MPDVCIIRIGPSWADDTIENMAVPELVDYIQEQTQQGESAQNLRESLMEAGWQELDIENALHDVAAGLHPATPGASIHEDLAQVRGMVAHLADRVKGIEATLASSIALPAQPQIGVQRELPSSFIGPDHELTAGHSRHTLARAVSLVVALGVAVLLGVYVTSLVSLHALAPLDQIVIAAAGGAFLIVMAGISMRRGHAWASSLLTAGAVALWATDALVSWRVYHYMDWMTATALCVLLLVATLVMGRWIGRLAR